MDLVVASPEKIFTIVSMGIKLHSQERLYKVHDKWLSPQSFSWATYV